MNHDRSKIPFHTMALLIPAAEAAVGKNWLPSLVLVLACFLLCAWMSTQDQPDWKWLRLLRCVTLILLLSWSLEWTHSCWPSRGAALVVPALLLVLACYGVWKGSGKTACAVLRYGMYLVLGILILLGLSQIKLDSLRPQAQLPDMRLAVMLLLPLLERTEGKGRYAWVGFAAIAAAIFTGGFASLYEYSRGLSIGGVTEHVESIAACGITVGYFGLLTYLLEALKQEGEEGWVLLAGSAGAYGLYLMGVEIRPELYAVLLLIMWVILPSLGRQKNKLKKGK